jgi:hypothetical protein
VRALWRRGAQLASAGPAHGCFAALRSARRQDRSGVARRHADPTPGCSWTSACRGGVAPSAPPTGGCRAHRWAGKRRADAPAPHGPFQRSAQSNEDDLCAESRNVSMTRPSSQQWMQQVAPTANLGATSAPPIAAAAAIAVPLPTASCSFGPAKTNKQTGPPPPPTFHQPTQLAG